jgi:hypothetical protein
MARNIKGIPINKINITTRKKNDTKEIPRKAAPPQDVNHPPTAKMTYTKKAASLVPDSAARWRAI